jgi:AbrB family looped-hinge helix DNA binding protein
MQNSLGDVTITGRGQVSLPAKGLRDLGWRVGDRLIVQRLGDDTLVLRRRPANWTNELAGTLGDVFQGTTEENVALVRRERASWNDV